MYSFSVKGRTSRSELTTSARPSPGCSIFKSSRLRREGLIAWVPIPNGEGWGEAGDGSIHRRPFGLGPRVGAPVASPQSLTLRPGRGLCERCGTHNATAWSRALGRAARLILFPTLVIGKRSGLRAPAWVALSMPQILTRNPGIVLAP